MILVERRTLICTSSSVVKIVISRSLLLKKSFLRKGTFWEVEKQKTPTSSSASCRFPIKEYKSKHSYYISYKKGHTKRLFIYYYLRSYRILKKIWSKSFFWNTRRSSEINWKSFESHNPKALKISLNENPAEILFFITIYQLKLEKKQSSYWKAQEKIKLSYKIKFHSHKQLKLSLKSLSKFSRLEKNS